MKPFNLEEAKAGKPVCTRDGRDVRIVCWDVMNVGNCIVVLVMERVNGESVQIYYRDGTPVNVIGITDTPHVLMMKSEKLEGWVCIFKESTGGIARGVSPIIYDSWEEAKFKGEASKEYIGYAHITWEE